MKLSLLKKAVLLNFISKYTIVFSNLFFSALFARILTPDDYGVVSIVTVFTNFFTMMGSIGIGPAVIQNKELSKKDENSIFAVTVCFGLVLAILFSIFSILMVRIYENPVYYTICFLLSISILFNTMNMVPNSLLLKEKQFKKVTVRDISVTMVSNILTLIMALLGFKYYALVIQSILYSVMLFIWNYKEASIKFSLRYELESVKKIWKFSSFQFAFEFVNYFSRNMDKMLIGKLLGNVELAYYDKGYKLTQYPVSNLSSVITPTLHPILSDHQNDKKYIYDKYIRILKFLSILGVFVTAFCIFASKELVLIVFGKQWVNSIVVFKWLSISIWSQMLCSSAGAIYQSLGKTKEMFVTGIVNTGIVVLSIIIGINMGSIGAVAFFVGVGYLINFVVCFGILILRGFQYSFWNFVKEFMADFFNFAILLIVILIYPINISNLIASFIIKLIVLGICYLILLIISKKLKFLVSFFHIWK